MRVFVISAVLIGAVALTPEPTYADDSQCPEPSYIARMKRSLLTTMPPLCPGMRRGWPATMLRMHR